MALLDLLGRKAALRVIWELRDARMTFRELVEAAATNPSVLNARQQAKWHAHASEVRAHWLPPIPEAPSSPSEK